MSLLLRPVRKMIALFMLATPVVYATPLVGFTAPADALPAHSTVRDETGTAVQLETYYDRPALLVFAYYSCPQLCGVLLAGLTDTLRQLDLRVGREFSVIVISIDEHDTAALAVQEKNRHLSRYARADAASGWHFFTADAHTLKSLTDAAGFHYVYDPIQRQFAHPAGVLVLHRGGVISDVIEGVSFDAAQLRVALTSSETAGTAHFSGQWRLLCGALDRNLGRYTGQVLNLLRASVLACALVGLWLWRRFTRRVRAHD